MNKYYKRVYSQCFRNMYIRMILESGLSPRINDDFLMLLHELIFTWVEKNSEEHLDQRAKYGHHREVKGQGIGGET